MPVYNGQRYLASSINSILKQSCVEWELIIVDDGSTDQSLSIANQFKDADSRIRIISRANTGICGALNDGIEAARGDWIARMDADDLAKPNRLALQLEFVSGCDNVVAVGGQVYLIDENGWKLGPKDAMPIKHDEIDQLLLNGGWPLVHPAMMIHRKTLCDCGGYRAELFPAEDHDLFLRLAERGRLANLQECILNYRLHINSVSHSRLNQQWRKIEAAVDEARKRRGLASREGLLHPAAAVQDSYIIHERWARLALHHGHRAAAVKHATIACTLNPTRVTNWKLVLRSILGISDWQISDA